MSDADREPPGQPGYPFPVHHAIRDQPHRPTDDIGLGVPLRRSGHRVRAAALAGTQPSELSSSGRPVEGDIGRLRAHRRGTTRPAVDPSGAYADNEPAVEARIAATGRLVAALEVE